MSADLNALQQQAPTAASAHNASANAALALIEGMVVNSELMYETAGEELRAVKAKLTELESARMNITRPMDAAKKAVMDLFKGPVAVLEKAEAVLKSKMLTYSQAQERKRREEQAAREEAARVERERLAKEAEALAAAGKVEEAAVKEQIAQLVVAVPPVEVEKPKAAGVSTVERWTFEVTSKAELVAFVAAHPEYLDVLDVNTTEVRRLVLAMKEKLPIAGIRPFATQSIAARA